MADSRVEAGNISISLENFITLENKQVFKKQKYRAMLKGHSSQLEISSNGQTETIRAKNKVVLNYKWKDKWIHMTMTW